MNRRRAIGALAGSAVLLAITSGNPPYAHLHGYRTLQREPQVAAVEMSMRWWFSETTWNNQGEPSRIQAIEPAINKWGVDLRYEWALQWQNVSDGSGSLEGSPAWRIWSGTEWFDTGHSQLLEPDCWHDLIMRGDVIDGMVHDIEMICDDTTIPLGQSFAPVATVGNDDLVVTLLLGGNYAQETPTNACSTTSRSDGGIGRVPGDPLIRTFPDTHPVPVDRSPHRPMPDPAPTATVLA